MPIGDKYKPGEALAARLHLISKKYANRILAQANRQVLDNKRYEIAIHLTKILDSLCLTAPSTTIAKTIKTIIDNFQDLIGVADKAPKVFTSFNIFVVKNKIVVTELSTALLKNLIRFTNNDLLMIHQQLNEIGFDQRDVKLYGLNQFYQQTVGKVLEAVWQQLMQTKGAD
ncbi:MAG: hypothetical protein V1765_00855 [bacterium]